MQMLAMTIFRIFKLKSVLCGIRIFEIKKKLLNIGSGRSVISNTQSGNSSGSRNNKRPKLENKFDNNEIKREERKTSKDGQKKVNVEKENQRIPKNYSHHDWKGVQVVFRSSKVIKIEIINITITRKMVIVTSVITVRMMIQGIKMVVQTIIKIREGIKAGTKLRIRIQGKVSRQGNIKKF